ncbi:hypothetical protein TRFO_38864 [Tritrichomonas foetus]|uniref:Tubby C-terminal domain-containing protein n=1 Tax=Tritrichomonas foetus TaxID=1144522 RepID=A0A1J4J6U4_9EUKA|nr:hypothetical protein TRFO_38864 [Tritrichomonas foetus]|eukprot:OHS94954.1 hypothetical protein TRFO_38864 [Tritrichomonas foetus]
MFFRGNLTEKTKMANNKSDQLNLRSFLDITNIQSRSCYTTRRQWTNKKPTHYIIKRIPSSNRENDSYSVNTPLKIPRPVFNTFECIRKKSTNIKGTRIVFSFHKGNETLFSAKFKGHKSFIPIVKGSNVHLKSSENEACLLFGNDFCDFSLRSKTNFGNEMMSIQFRKYDYEAKFPRRLFVFFFNHSNSLPSKLVNAEPEASDENTWTVDLNSNDAMSSIKNCRIEDDNHKPFAFIRKKKSDTLEIEAQDVIENVCLFALAIASFLCKK